MSLRVDSPFDGDIHLADAIKPRFLDEPSAEFVAFESNASQTSAALQPPIAIAINAQRRARIATTTTVSKKRALVALTEDEAMDADETPASQSSVAVVAGETRKQRRAHDENRAANEPAPVNEPDVEQQQQPPPPQQPPPHNNEERVDASAIEAQVDDIVAGVADGDGAPLSTVAKRATPPPPRVRKVKKVVVEGSAINEVDQLKALLGDAVDTADDGQA